MKKKSFVEWMTSFISNMRVERPESSIEDPLNKALVDAMREQIDCWIMNTNTIESGFEVVLVFEKEQVLDYFNYKEDLPEELQEEFLRLQPFNASIVELIANGITYDVSWSYDVNWGEEQSSPFAVVTSDMQVISYLGNPRIVVGGVTYTGAEAVQQIMGLVLTSPDADVKARFTIGKEFLDLSTPGPEEELGE